VKNIIVLGNNDSPNHAENVLLTHGLPFFAHKEFDVQKISFIRQFTKETQINGFGSGWETMVVPFNVQKIESGGRVLMPFGDVDTDKGECPFWLFSANDTEWKGETSIFANTPYLIAMPNHPFYADEFVVNGDVTFSSKVVTVPVTPDEIDMKYSFGAGRTVSGNYEWISKNEGKLAINEMATTYQNQDYQPGGIFISNERDIAPFECFVESQGARAIPVFDQSAVDDLLGDLGTRIWSERYSICIRSSIGMKIRIFDMVGQLIRIVNVKAGETVRVDDITPGIYFVGTTKVMVKG
ncbi:MAG: T9SS type A sorting domain-containing protein, partial [Muribaculaceae bacterium]|nr:T9SS type A sorting domain-containing protein [Muribaculaceae bacterium]